MSATLREEGLEERIGGQPLLLMGWGRGDKASSNGGPKSSVVDPIQFH
jgi:hypothetical protein